MEKPTKCDFCDKERNEVAILVARRDATQPAICNECATQALTMFISDACDSELRRRELKRDNKELREALREAVAFLNSLAGKVLLPRKLERWRRLSVDRLIELSKGD